MVTTKEKYRVPAESVKGAVLENQQETERAGRKDSEEGLQREYLFPVGVSRAQVQRKAGPLGSGTAETGEQTASHLSRK